MSKTVKRSDADSLPRFHEMPATYVELLNVHVPRPIRTEDEAVVVNHIVDEMAGRKLTTDQSDYLEILTGLLLAYEADRTPKRTKMTPLEAVRAVVEEAELTPADLGRILGDRTLGTRILSGERELSKAHIRRLAEHFKLSPELFI